MLPKTLADKLTRTGGEQVLAGLKAKQKRMKTLADFYDSYNNKIPFIGSDMTNIPLPFFCGLIDELNAKIDNPPTLDYKVPNKKTLAEKIKSAWVQEMSSTKADWASRDRSEKKQALLTGRAVSKVYASSVGNKYQSHYDFVDVFSFVADPTKGRLTTLDKDTGNYHGETDIFRTYSDLKEGVDAGLYDAGQVAELKERMGDPSTGNKELYEFKRQRLKATEVDVEKMSYAGQKGVNLTEWIMRFEGKLYYLFFDPLTLTWVRADELKDVFASGKTHFNSWATHPDENSFWSKGPADDFHPVAEAMRLLVNEAVENQKRRNRPQRIVEAGMLQDINQLQDYVPDDVILTKDGVKPNEIVTVETPEVIGSLNLVQFLDNLIDAKSGVADPSIQEGDAKVGIFYGQLRNEADRIGVINKQYSKSYADKGYNFFWGLKQHLTEPKQIEMLGAKGGAKLRQLKQIDFKDVDDVDDVIPTGGSQQEEQDLIAAERQTKTISELATAYPNSMNPTMVIRTNLKNVGLEEDQIEQFLDVHQSIDEELMREADEAIQEILLGGTPKLNQGATTQYAKRILDFVRDELSYVELDDKGNEVGEDEETKEKAQKLVSFVNAHFRNNIVVRNMMRRQQEKKLAMAGIEPIPEEAQAAIESVQTTTEDQRASVARPFEGNIRPAEPGTPQGTAQQSARIANQLSP